MARWALGSLGRSSSLFALAGGFALSCAGAPAPKQSARSAQPACADWGSRAPAFEPGTATPIASSFQLMTAVPRTPTERFSACTRPDVRVVTGKSQGFSDVPVALASALSRPFRAPTTGIALASDSAGTKPLAMDNLLLVEVFDAFGSRVAAVYAGATAGSPVTLDGRPLERYGADSFEVGPMLLGRAEGIAPDTPLRLRVTSLDNGDTGATSDVYVVPPPPLSDRERGIVVTNATYGGSCGVRAGNATGFVAWSCNGRAACDYRVDYKTIGDPAPGCTKDFRVEWQCGARAELRRGAILGEAGLGSSLALACN